MTEAAPTTLADLRGEIDRIDSAMHVLLMERSQIIETLISIKKTQASGSAFRPGREADIMKRLALSHKGLLPLRYGRERLAHHHRDLHLCAGELLGPCRYLRRRCGDARFRPLPFRLHRPLYPA